MDSEVASTRHVSPLLATAIYALPAIFVWLLLRKGYAPSTRRAAFLYAGMITAIGVLGTMLGR
jgi:hypothetical protein